MKLTTGDFAEIVAALGASGTVAGGEEKRRAVRVSVSAKLQMTLIQRGELGETLTGLTRDISLTGIGLIQATPMQRSQQLLMVLPKPSAQPLCVCATVMQCRPLTKGLFMIGCDFTAEPSSELREHVLSRAAARPHETANR